MDKLTFKEWSILSDLEIIAPLEEDFEFSMARGELKTAKSAINRLMRHLKGEGDLEAWVQSKITKASEYLDTVADHMDGGEDDTEKKKEVKEGKCDCDCGQDPCVKCGKSHHDIKEEKDSKEMKSCPDGKYWCMTDKKCKKIPKGWHVMKSGYLMKDKEHEEEENKNGNGNGEGSESNGGGVSEGNDIFHQGNPNPQMRNMPMGQRNVDKLASSYSKSIKSAAVDGLSSLSKAAQSAKNTKIMKSPSVRVAEGCGGTHETKKKKKKLSEMISTSSVTGRRFRDVSGADDQKQLEKEKKEKEGEKRESAKKRKDELATERITKGIRFYDKKGSGYIRDGKKVYDESYNLDEKCWKGYTQKGMKKKGDKVVPNCVPTEEYSDWRSELEEVYMFSSPKKNKETPKKKETWYERDERKAKEKKLRKESTEVQEGNKSGDSSLRDWFTKSRASDGTPGWVQLGGKYAGKPCAKQPGQTTKPKCGSSKMKADLSDKEEERAFRRKNQEDPNPDRRGKAKNVATEEKDHEVSMAHKQLNKTIANAKQLKKDLGKKEKNIPAWVQAKITDTDHNMDAASGYLAKEAAGEKDACYSKVKSRYSVWPSAYASGALVKCRKVGAKNWGNKTQKEGYEFSNWRDDFKATEYETVDIIETTPLKESEEIRYCPKCKKNEKKRECRYGEKYWTMFSLPASLGGGGAYDPNEVHPANEGLSFEIGGGHKKAQKMGKIRNLSKGATGGEKDAAQAALKRLGGGISLPLADQVIYPGQLKTEDYQRLQSTGNVFSIMLMWRGKTYRLQLFFSGPKRPSREEVNAEIQKFYPGGVLTHYYPSPSDPTQPIVVIPGK